MHVAGFGVPHFKHAGLEPNIDLLQVSHHQSPIRTLDSDIWLPLSLVSVAVIVGMFATGL